MRIFLKEERIKRKLNQSNAAKKIGITRQYYNMIENGERNPSVTLAKKMGKLFTIDWKKFFDE